MDTKALNTRLIAEFMGYEVILYQSRPTYNGHRYAKTVGEQKALWNGLEMEITGRFVTDVRYPFDTDFNYLLPIIRKIEESGYVVRIAGISYQVHKVLDEANPIVSLVCGDLSKKTEMVYSLLIEFLKTLNQSNNGSN